MEVPRIDYALPLPLHRRTNVRRGIFFAAGVAIIVPLVWIAGPALGRNMRLKYWQRQALDYSPPADQIVLDDDPSDVPRLLHDTRYVPVEGGTAAVLFAKPWDRLNALWSPPGREPSATLFMHERKNSKGESRLVVVEGWIDRVTGFGMTTKVPRSDVKLSPYVAAPGSAVSDPLTYSAQNSRFAESPHSEISSHTRWWAGQIDSKDPSHFTILYELDGSRTVLDGWLLDDDTVKIEER